MSRSAPVALRLVVLCLAVQGCGGTPSSSAVATSGSEVAPVITPTRVTALPVDAHAQIEVEGAVTRYVIGGLRYELEGDVLRSPDTIVAGSLVAMLHGDDGWTFLARDGEMFASATFLGPLSRLDTRAPTPFRPLALDGMIAIVDGLAAEAEPGTLEVLHGGAFVRAGGLEEGSVWNAVSLDATHVAVRLVGGGIAISQDGGASFTGVASVTAASSLRAGDGEYVVELMPRRRFEDMIVGGRARVSPAGEVLEVRPPAVSEENVEALVGAIQGTSLATAEAVERLARALPLPESGAMDGYGVVPLPSDACRELSRGHVHVASCGTTLLRSLDEQPYTPIVGASPTEDADLRVSADGSRVAWLGPCVSPPRPEDATDERSSDDDDYEGDYDREEEFTPSDRACVVALATGTVREVPLGEATELGDVTATRLWIPGALVADDGTRTPLPEGEVRMLGDGTVLVRSREGATLTLVSGDVIATVTPPGPAPRAIDFVDARRGVALADDLYVTSDAGLTWQSAGASFGADLQREMRCEGERCSMVVGPYLAFVVEPGAGAPVVPAIVHAEGGELRTPRRPMLALDMRCTASGDAELPSVAPTTSIDPESSARTELGLGAARLELERLADHRWSARWRASASARRQSTAAGTLALEGSYLQVVLVHASQAVALVVLCGEDGCVLARARAADHTLAAVSLSEPLDEEAQGVLALDVATGIVVVQVVYGGAQLIALDARGELVGSRWAPLGGVSVMIAPAGLTGGAPSVVTEGRRVEGDLELVGVAREGAPTLRRVHVAAAPPRLAGAEGCGAGTALVGVTRVADGAEGIVHFVLAEDGGLCVERVDVLGGGVFAPDDAGRFAGELGGVAASCVGSPDGG